MFHKKVRIVLVALACAVSVFFIVDHTLLPGLSFNSSDYDIFKVLGRAISLVRSQYIDDPNPGKTMEGAFKGMIDSLDVQSCYLDPLLMRKFQQRREKNITGIGVVLYKRYGAFAQVIGIREDSPALEKGLEIGDIITAIGKRSTLLMSMQEANLSLISPAPNPLNLKVMRASRSEEVTVSRRPAPPQPVQFHNDKAAFLHIEIEALIPPAAKQIRKEIFRKKNTLKAVILDIRNCSEGEYSEAAKLVRIFLNEENLGYFANKLGPTKKLTAEGKEGSESLPVFVWLNQATFSAAEVAAGILQQHKRAVLIGQSTPGLAGSQTLFKFDDGSGMLLTTEVFHLSSGKMIWEEGVSPDHELPAREMKTAAFLGKTEEVFSKN